LKKILFSILTLALLFSACSAEVLMSPMPLGQDKVAVQGFYSCTPVKLSGENIIVYGPKMIYGINDSLDLFGKIGSATYGTTGSTVVGIGGKYAVPKTLLDVPLNIAAVLSYDSNSGKDVAWSTISLGLIASKYLRNNFTVYGALYGVQNSVKVSGSRSADSNDIQWGLGAKYQYNRKYGFLAELMMFTAASDSYSTFSVACQYNM